MVSKDIVITKEHAGKRLDLSLFMSLPELTRSYIKKVLESNSVLVNGEVEYRANRKVREGDVIHMEYDGSNDSHNMITPENIDLDVIYEDDDLIAINKPAGMVVHPANGNWGGTVMNGIVHKYEHLKEVGTQIRSSLIHRLDKDTSGLLLIGKSNLGLWHYSKMFANRRIEKHYIACCKGTLEKEYDYLDEFEIQNYVARNKFNRKKMSVVSEMNVHRKSIESKKFQKLRSSQREKGRITSSQVDLPHDARIAHTGFKLLERMGNTFLFDASPKTGRTHQIRVHVASIGTPIIGDSVYGGVENPRMLLHAYQITVPGTNGKTIKLCAPIDKEFRENLVQLGFDTSNLVCK